VSAASYSLQQRNSSLCAETGLFSEALLAGEHGSLPSHALWRVKHHVIEARKVSLGLAWPAYDTLLHESVGVRVIKVIILASGRSFRQLTLCILLEVLLLVILHGLRKSITSLSIKSLTRCLIVGNLLIVLLDHIVLDRIVPCRPEGLARLLCANVQGKFEHIIAEGGRQLYGTLR